MQDLLADESLKKQRRDVEKKMTVHVQQISATVEQVGGNDVPQGRFHAQPCCRAVLSTHGLHS